MGKEQTGVISWHDLTVADAEGIRDFYSEVLGWQAQAVSMGDYDDYAMAPADGAEPVAGICHARGSNAGLPPQWLMYVTVDDLDRALSACEAHGGARLSPVRSMGADRYCVIRDPAGAVLAIYQKG